MTEREGEKEGGREERDGGKRWRWKKKRRVTEKESEGEGGGRREIGEGGREEVMGRREWGGRLERGGDLHYLYKTVQKIHELRDNIDSTKKLPDIF